MVSEKDITQKQLNTI